MACIYCRSPKESMLLWLALGIFSICLSVAALYAAKAALKRRGTITESSAPAPKLIPVRVATAASMVRVLLPNGVVVELPDSIDPKRCQALLAGASALL